MLKFARITKVSYRLYSSNHKVVPIRLNEKSETLNFMRSYFVKDEPLSKSLGMLKTAEDATVGWDYYFSSLIDNGDAYKVEDSGKIIAVGMVSLKENGKGSTGLPKVNDPAFEKISELVAFIENKVDMYNRFDIEKYCYIECIGVHEDYRKLGLFQLLARHSEELAKSLGCRYLTTLTSGAYSKNGSANIGMKEVYSIKFSDYKVDGEVVFKTAPPHIEATYLAKNI